MTSRRSIAVAGMVLFTLAGLVVVFALARADRTSIRDERDASKKAAVNVYNIDFMQRSLKRQRLREACDTIDAATASFPPLPHRRAGPSSELASVPDLPGRF